MIYHLREERERLLGRPPGPEVRTSSEKPTGPDLGDRGEPPAEERLRNPFGYRGYTAAEPILSNMGISFTELKNDHDRFGKPVLDVGASASTLAFEGAYRDIRVFMTDPTYDLANPMFFEALRWNIEKLKDSYTTPRSFGAGFEVAAFKPEHWDAYVDLAIQQISADRSKCFASAICNQQGEQMPDRFFSTTLAHISIPKYSHKEVFLHKELPELLRVTEHRVVLSPLVTAGPGQELIHLAGSKERETLDKVVHDHGFAMELRQSPTYTSKVANAEAPPGFDIVGVFVRKR
jgi:hypothetical protein